MDDCWFGILVTECLCYLLRKARLVDNTGLGMCVSAVMLLFQTQQAEVFLSYVSINVKQEVGCGSLQFSGKVMARDAHWESQRWHLRYGNQRVCQSKEQKAQARAQGTPTLRVRTEDRLQSSSVGFSQRGGFN